MVPEAPVIRIAHFSQSIVMGKTYCFVRLTPNPGPIFLEQRGALVHYQLETSNETRKKTELCRLERSGCIAA